MKTGFHLLVNEGSAGDYSRAHFLLFSLETVQARSVCDVTAKLHVGTVTHTSAINVQYRAPNLKMQDYVQSHTFATPTAAPVPQSPRSTGDPQRPTGKMSFSHSFMEVTTLISLKLNSNPFVKFRGRHPLTLTIKPMVTVGPPINPTCMRLDWGRKQTPHS